MPPINYIFKLLQTRSKVSIWLYEQLGIRIEGTIRVCAYHQGSLMRAHYADVLCRVSTSS